MLCRVFSRREILFTHHGDLVHQFLEHCKQSVVVAQIYHTLFHCFACSGSSFYKPEDRFPVLWLMGAMSRVHPESAQYFSARNSVANTFVAFAPSAVTETVPQDTPPQEQSRKRPKLPRAVKERARPHAIEPAILDNPSQLLMYPREMRERASIGNTLLHAVAIAPSEFQDVLVARELVRIVMSAPPAV